MRIDEASFQVIEDESGQRFVRVLLSGEDFERRAAPIVAMVGDQTVYDFSIDLDGLTAIGTLDEEPPLGARLRIGYLNQEELLDTGIDYVPDQV